MDLISTINFGVTIGLGLLSLGISIFSVILAMHFSKESNKNLSCIQELTNEIKILSSNTLNNQQKYSDKMLDSILNQNRYGEEREQKIYFDDTLKLIVNKTREDIGNALNLELEKLTKKSGLPENIKDDISQSIKDTDIDYNKIKEKFKLPITIRKFIEKKKNLPANYILLRGIVRSNAACEDDIKNNEKEYGIPNGWEIGALDELFDIGLLDGSKNSFRISDGLEDPIRIWLDINEGTINKIINIYKNESEMNSPERAREISENEIIML